VGLTAAVREVSLGRVSAAACSRDWVRPPTTRTAMYMAAQTRVRAASTIPTNSPLCIISTMRNLLSITLPAVTGEGPYGVLTQAGDYAAGVTSLSESQKTSMRGERRKSRSGVAPGRGGGREV